MSSSRELPPVTQETLEGELLPFVADVERSSDGNEPFEADFGLPSLDHIGHGDTVASDAHDADDARAEDTEAPASTPALMAPSLLVPEPRLSPTPIDDEPVPASDEVGPRRKRRQPQDEVASPVAPQPVEDEHTVAAETVHDEVRAEHEAAAWSDIAAEAAELVGDTERVAEVEAQHGQVSLDDDDRDEGEPVEQWQPSFAVSASEARYEQPSAIGLLPPKHKTPDHDERNGVLAAFADLAPGESAVVRVSLRADDEARPEHRAWLEAVKRGETPKRPSKGRKAAALAGRATAWSARAIYRAVSSNATPPQAMTPVPPPQLSEETARQVEYAEHKYEQGGKTYETTLRVAVVGKPENAERLSELRRDIEQHMHDIGQSTAPQQRLSWSECNGYDAVAGVLPPRADTKPTALRMSAAELAPLVAPYGDLADPHGVKVARAQMKPLEPTDPHPIADPFAPPAGRLPVGIVNPESDDKYVHSIATADLDMHMVGVGRTGSGKSVWIEHLVNAIVRDPYRATIVIDPLGNLGNDLLQNLARFCPERLDDVVMVDLLGTPQSLRGHEGLSEHYSVAFNPLDVQSEEEISERLSSLSQVMQSQMQLNPSSTPRAKNYADQTLLALMYANLVLPDEHKLTMLHVPVFLQDPVFRVLCVDCCPVPAVKSTFGADGRYAQLTDRMREEHIGPMLRAFQPFETNAVFADVFSSPTNKLDWVRLITERKIVIVKLAALSGEQQKLSQFIGQTMLPALLGSMREWGRKKDGKSAAERNRGVYLVVDEAPLMVENPDSGVTQALAVGRQFGFCFLGFSQFWGQYHPEVRKAFVNNTYTKLALVQDDPNDCKQLADVLSRGKGTISGQDISNLPRFHGYAVQGEGGAFAFAGLPPLAMLAEQQGQTVDEVALDEARAAAYRRSWATVGNSQSEMVARRRAVPVTFPAEEQGGDPREGYRPAAVHAAVEELTRQAQARIAQGVAMSPVAAPAKPVAGPAGSITGPTPTAPNASAPTGPLDQSQTDLFDPSASIWDEHAGEGSA